MNVGAHDGQRFTLGIQIDLDPATGVGEIILPDTDADLVRLGAGEYRDSVATFIG